MLLDLQVYNYIGIVGMIIILVLFLLNQMDKLKNNSLCYDFGNFLGSVLLVYFAVRTNSLPFIILNLVWAFVSLKDVIFYFLKK